MSILGCFSVVSVLISVTQAGYLHTVDYEQNNKLDESSEETYDEVEGSNDFLGNARKLRSKLPKATQSDGTRSTRPDAMGDDSEGVISLSLEEDSGNDSKGEDGPRRIEEIADGKKVDETSGDIEWELNKNEENQIFREDEVDEAKDWIMRTADIKEHEKSDEYHPGSLGVEGLYREAIMDWKDHLGNGPGVGSDESNETSQEAIMDREDRSRNEVDYDVRAMQMLGGPRSYAFLKEYPIERRWRPKAYRRQYLNGKFQAEPKIDGTGIVGRKGNSTGEKQSSENQGSKEHLHPDEQAQGKTVRSDSEGELQALGTVTDTANQRDNVTAVQEWQTPLQILSAALSAVHQKFVKSKVWFAFDIMWFLIIWLSFAIHDIGRKLVALNVLQHPGKAFMIIQHEMMDILGLVLPLLRKLIMQAIEVTRKLPMKAILLFKNFAFIIFLYVHTLGKLIVNAVQQALQRFVLPNIKNVFSKVNYALKMVYRKLFGRK